MMTYQCPVERLGRPVREMVQDHVDQFRRRMIDSAGLRARLSSLGFTDAEANRYMLLVIATEA